MSSNSETRILIGGPGDGMKAFGFVPGVPLYFGWFETMSEYAAPEPDDGRTLLFVGEVDWNSEFLAKDVEKEIRAYLRRGSQQLVAKPDKPKRPRTAA